MESRHKKVKRSYQYNPFEIAVCGYKNTGKTTLLEKIVRFLSSKYTITYIKHDAHKFSIDQPGKDTHRLAKSGAHTTMISDERHYALIAQKPLSPHRAKLLCYETDMALIEGYKHSNLPKLVMLDTAGKMLEEIKSDRVQHILALVGEGNATPETQQVCDAKNIKYFDREDHSIYQFISHYLHAKTSQIPVYGLVLAGGHSTRMKKDKGALNYHGIPQRDYAARLLAKFCDRVFVSCRPQQNIEFTNFDKHTAPKLIHDQILNIGPLGGIISAQREFPQAAWLVLACDLPYVQAETIQSLIKARNPFRVATTYINPDNRMPEPLCAIWEPKSYHAIMDFISLGYECPRKILLNSAAHQILPNSKYELANINIPEEFDKAKQHFSQIANTESKWSSV